MRLDYTAPLPEPIGFLLVEQFSMMAFFSAVEPLRIANRIAGEALFEWIVISEHGAPVTASNGMTVMADRAIDEVHHLPSLAVCAGFMPERSVSRHLLGWLNRLAHGGCTLGGLDTGCFLLAEAGLLDGQRVTLHWESLPAFRERYPAIATSDELYELGARRFSCAGGTAAMDMALDMIARRHGTTLAHDVAEQLVHARMRPRNHQQRPTLARRLGVNDRHVLSAVAAMERRLEAPLTLAALAGHAGVSARQLQRLFMRHLGVTPRQWYLRLRLERARTLLHDTDLDILGVGLACGFASSASFSRAYRDHYGHAPREERRAR